MKALSILISPTGEEWYGAYGPMTKDRTKATRFESVTVAERASLARFGRAGTAFLDCERRAEEAAYRRFKDWTYRVEEVNE